VFLIKWERVLASNAKGGLDIGSLKAFNLALLEKWRWRLANNLNMLWVQVINAIHGENAGFDHGRCITNGLWKKIVDSITQLHSSGIVPLETLRYKMGCGTKVRFWKDIWIGDTPLMQRYIRLFRLDPYPNCVVIDRLQVLQVEMTSFTGRDEVRWELGNDVAFTVKETREHIDDNILPTLDAPTIWCKSISRKLHTSGAPELSLQDIDCGGKCRLRCSKASRTKMCLRACGTCCKSCHCVPPGTYGNYDACSCYANMKTRGGRRKCP
ncbi:RNA-directed DNA polymerase, eukaryota, reverse transcriptase zinc-binding domain protein, partial [Tanacetum coccineum]